MAPVGGVDEIDALAKRAVAGDGDAFAALTRALLPAWYRIASHLVDDQTSVDDVVQDIALKVHLALPKWNGDASVRTWSYRIAVNACHDARREMRRAAKQLPIESAINIAAPTASGRTTDDPFARDAIAQCIAQLPPELGAVVSLRYGADLGFAEIARVLAIPQGTVSTRLRRALALLGKTLGPTFDKE